MPKYTVGFAQTTHTYVEVEADSYREAIDKASMETPRTSGDWEPSLVLDADGEEVWSDIYGEA